MSAHAPEGNDSQRRPPLYLDRLDEPAWLEFYNAAVPSPAAVWASDEEDEITIQPPRASSERSTSVADEFAEVKKANHRVRVLDEWAILPGEASYATVKLNQELEESACQEGVDAKVDRVDRTERISATTSTQPRRLDESQVLPGEVSFATVMLSSSNTKRSYSPLEEFRVKTNFNLRPTLVGVASLLAVVFVAAAVFLALKIRNDNSAAQPIKQPTESVSYSTKNNALETEQSVKPGPAPNLKSAASSLKVKEAKVVGVTVAERKTARDSTNSGLVKSSAETARQEVSLKPPKANGTSSSQDSALVRDKKQKVDALRGKSAAKETPAARKVDVSAKASTKPESSKPVRREPESPSPKPAELRKEEPTPSTTGEGVRPRRVSP